MLTLTMIPRLGRDRSLALGGFDVAQSRQRTLAAQATEYVRGKKDWWRVPLCPTYQPGACTPNETGVSHGMASAAAMAASI